MEKLGALIFIDANQYLYLYTIPNSKKLIDYFLEQQEYIFITAQVVKEVQRNKLRISERFLIEQIKKLDISIPDYLNIAGKTASNLRSQIKDIKREIENAAIQTLQCISRSEDEVSKAVASLFNKALAHTPEEIERARTRKERGNPPGKPENTLGDQLTWEQLLSACHDKTKLWIISNDSDYSIKYQDKLFLNPFLYQDIIRLDNSTLSNNVFCFDKIFGGIKNFITVTEVQAKNSPTEEDSREIEEELDKLPPPGWLSYYRSDSSYNKMFQDIQRSKDFVEAIDTRLSSSFYQF